jgi:hypothetical protein
MPCHTQTHFAHLQRHFGGEAVSLPHHHQVSGHGGWLSAKPAQEGLLAVVVNLGGEGVAGAAQVCAGQLGSAGALRHLSGSLSIGKSKCVLCPMANKHKRAAPCMRQPHPGLPGPSLLPAGLGGGGGASAPHHPPRRQAGSQGSSDGGRGARGEGQLPRLRLLPGVVHPCALPSCRGAAVHSCLLRAGAACCCSCCQQGQQVYRQACRCSLRLASAGKLRRSGLRFHRRWVSTCLGCLQPTDSLIHVLPSLQDNPKQDSGFASHQASGLLACGCPRHTCSSPSSPAKLRCCASGLEGPVAVPGCSCRLKLPVEARLDAHTLTYRKRMPLKRAREGDSRQECA